MYCYFLLCALIVYHALFLTASILLERGYVFPSPLPNLSLSLSFSVYTPPPLTCNHKMMSDHQVEQHEQLMSEFEGNYTELKNHCFELQHNFFRAVEEHEEAFFNSVGQLAQVSA